MLTSSDTPMRVSSSSQFDVSTTFGGMTPGDSMLATPASRILRSSKVNATIRPFFLKQLFRLTFFAYDDLK